MLGEDILRNEFSLKEKKNNKNEDGGYGGI